MRWTWFVERDRECWPETFDTPAKAIAVMAERQGWDSTDMDVVARMAAIGFFLAIVQVTVKPMMVLRAAGATDE